MWLPPVLEVRPCRTLEKPLKVTRIFGVRENKVKRKNWGLKNISQTLLDCSKPAAPVTVQLFSAESLTSNGSPSYDSFLPIASKTQPWQMWLQDAECCIHKSKATADACKFGYTEETSVWRSKAYRRSLVFAISANCLRLLKAGTVLRRHHFCSPCCTDWTPSDLLSGKSR